MKSKKEILDSISFRLYNCDFELAKHRRLGYEIEQMYEMAIDEAMASTSASQSSPGSKYWIEKDAVKEPPEEADYYYCKVQEGDDEPYRKLVMFSLGSWCVDDEEDSFAVLTYLLPTDHQGWYTVEEILAWYQGKGDEYREQTLLSDCAKDYIQSLKH